MKHELNIPWYLIWRFITRGNKWSLGLTIFLMAVAFINMIFISSLFNGIIAGTNDQIINTYTGHLMLRPASGQDTLTNIDQLLGTIEQTGGVVAASPETSVPGSLQYQGIRGGWEILAIDPSRERQVTNVANYMIAGDYLAPDDQFGIIIGRQIAGGAGVENDAFSFKTARVGEVVSLETAGLAKDFTIRGIFYTKFINTDSRAFISQSALESILPSANDRATDIVIRLDKKGHEASTIADLQSRGVSGDFLTWQDASGLMKSVTKSFLSINVLMSTVGIMIAAITIFIVVYIDIINKRRQIGILRAIGIKNYLIRGLYVIQTAVYSFTGVCLGTAIFFGAIVPYFNANPFVLPICDAVLVTNAADFIFRAEAVMLVALLSGLIPAILVTRVKMLDAIRGK